MTDRAKPTSHPALREAMEAARVYLDRETLEDRRMDSLDFFDISVASVRHIVQVAFEAGRTAAEAEGAKRERRRRPPVSCECPACGRRIDIVPLT